jgi:hypothetical protein
MDSMAHKESRSEESDAERADRLRREIKEIRESLLGNALYDKFLHPKYGIRYKNVGPFRSFSLVFIRRKPYFLMYMIKKNENLPSMWIIQN